MGDKSSPSQVHIFTGSGFPGSKPCVVLEPQRQLGISNSKAFTQPHVPSCKRILAMVTPIMTNEMRRTGDMLETLGGKAVQLLAGESDDREIDKFGGEGS
jgi:hypothetical protein